MTTHPATSVATVGGRPIPLAWVEERLASLLQGRLGRHLPPGESDEMQRLRRWIVQESVTRMVLLHEADRAGLWSWPDYVSQGGLSSDRMPDLPDDCVARLFELVTRDVTVPAAEVDAYLARDPDAGLRPEARRVRWVIAKTEAGSRAWLAAPDEGLTPDHGDEIRQGEMWLHRGELVGPLEDAVFRADVGQVVGPLRLEQGWTIARLEAIAPAAGLAKQALRASVETELRRSAQTRAFDAWIDARRAALARIEDAYQHPGHPVHGILQHRH